MNHLSSQLMALPNAGLWRRLGAMLYDSFLIIAICWAYAALILWFRVAVLDQSFAPTEKASLGSLGFVGMLLVITLFYCFFWHRAGQTLGMRTWRLQIVTQAGTQPNWIQCICRCLIAPFSLCIGGLGYLWCLFDPQGCFHDRITKTRIVVLPSNKH